MPLIYFAGPLFNDAERSFNARLTDAIEALGYTVFLPQRDGAERDREPYMSMTRDERRKAMFTLDRDTILACDIFLFVLDGRVPDEGAAFELGVAYADQYLNRKPRLLLGLQTDARAAFLQSKLNPMLRVPLDRIFDTEAELLAFLEDQKQGG